MLDCTTDKYDLIYAPWLERGFSILDGVDLRPGMRVLDLCGGSGAVAMEALRRQPRLEQAALLDLNPRCLAASVDSTKGRAEYVDGLYPLEWFDVVVCRQGIGYLDIQTVFPGVARILKSRGVFVFNSFVKPKWFGVKTYQHHNVPYDEAHLCMFGRVFHLQHRQGVGADVSVFRYHSPDEIPYELMPYFYWDKRVNGKSIHWHCTRKP